MQAVYITKNGAPSVLEVREVPDPVPENGEILIDVRAAGLNFAEVMARKGLYPDAPKPPCVVGYEGAGVVAALGRGVVSPAVGTRVMFMSRFGAHASKVIVTTAQAFPIPDSLSFEEAAALPVVYLTAYHMLFHVFHLRPRSHVLIHMAAGGVGTAALQLCRTVPDVVTYGTASASKHDYVRKHGCTHPIDYRSQDYAAEVRRLTNDRGVDLVLDALGGADWARGYELLAPAGMLIAFGLANANTASGRRNLFNVAKQLVSVPRFSPMKLMDDNRTVAGVNMGHLFSEVALLSDEMRHILELVRKGKLRPHVDKSFPFSRAADAHAELELGKNMGKVVLTPD